MSTSSIDYSSLTQIGQGLIGQFEQVAQDRRSVRTDLVRVCRGNRRMRCEDQRRGREVGSPRIVPHQLFERAVRTPQHFVSVERGPRFLESAAGNPRLDERRDLTAVDEARSLVSEIDLVQILKAGNRGRNAGGLDQTLPLAAGEGAHHHIPAVASSEIARVGSVEVIPEPATWLVHQRRLGDEAKVRSNRESDIGQRELDKLAFAGSGMTSTEPT